MLLVIGYTDFYNVFIFTLRFSFYNLPESIIFVRFTVLRY